MNTRANIRNQWAAMLLAGLCLLSNGAALGAGQQKEGVSSGTSVKLPEVKRLNQEALKLYAQGKYDEAVPLARRVLAIREKVLGPERPAVATSLNSLALLYHAKGDYVHAERCIDVLWQSTRKP